MQKREIFTAKTVEEAVQAAAAAFSVTVADLDYTVLDESRGFLGLGSEVKIEATCEIEPEVGAREFVERVLYDMGLEESRVEASKNEDGDVVVTVAGDHLGAIIGRHGEVMDSLQYLTSLVINRAKNDYTRVVLDIEGYRAKRAQSLEELADRMAERVTRTGRAVTLEPMNPYERRIIHSRVQTIEGVTTFSVGEGEDRKIVVAPEGADPETIEIPDAPKPRRERRERRDRRGRGDRRDRREKAPRKSNVDYAAIAAALPPREVREVVKAKSIDDLGLADVEDTVDVILK